MVKDFHVIYIYILFSNGRNTSFFLNIHKILLKFGFYTLILDKLFSTTLKAAYSKLLKNKLCALSTTKSTSFY